MTLADPHFEHFATATPPLADTAFIFIPGSLCPPAIIGPAARSLPLPTWGVHWMQYRQYARLADIAQHIYQVLSASGKRIILAGHSTGAVIAALVALQDTTQERRILRGLTLAHSGPNTLLQTDILSIIDNMGKQWGPDFFRIFVDRCVFRTDGIDPDMLSTMRIYPEQLDAAFAIAMLKDQARLDLAPRLPLLAGTPTRIIAGEHDRARPLDDVRQLHHLIPGSVFQVLPTGHTSMIEMPQAFSDIIRSLLPATP